jgi:hypothetical protein
VWVAPPFDPAPGTSRRQNRGTGNATQLCRHQSQARFTVVDSRSPGLRSVGVAFSDRRGADQRRRDTWPDGLPAFQARDDHACRSEGISRHLHSAGRVFGKQGERRPAAGVDRRGDQHLPARELRLPRQAHHKGQGRRQEESRILQTRGEVWRNWRFSEFLRKSPSILRKLHHRHRHRHRASTERVKGKDKTCIGRKEEIGRGNGRSV